MKVHVWEEGSEWHFLIVSATGKLLAGQGEFTSAHLAWFEAGCATRWIFARDGIPSEGIAKVEGKP